MATIKIVFLQAALDFLASLPKQAYRKVLYNIDRVLIGEKDAELFSKLGDTDIWEFRTQYNGIAYRLFAFWDKKQESIVIATHGIVKKSQKTPQKEIEKAERMRIKYFKENKQ